MLQKAAPFSAIDDPVEIARALVRRRSVTPADDDCLALVAGHLEATGLEVDLFRARADGQEVTNLIARGGAGAPVFAFAGHTDVVPAGDPRAWRHPPFAGEVADGALVGRGAVDMKGAVAAFLAALRTHHRAAAGGRGTVLVLLTGDEEEGGAAGMRAILTRMQGRQPTPEFCLIGEPSNEGTFGQGVRIGRRGSLNLHISARGRQGHVAWPDRADNALHRLMDVVGALRRVDLGAPEACFPASHLEVTQVTADSSVGNVIPGQAEGRANIRFNRRHTGAGLEAMLNEVARGFGDNVRLAARVSGEPYLAEDPYLAEVVAREVERVCGRRPTMNAGGGVSDGRFLRAVCPVVEFGLVGDTAHQAGESAPIADILALTDVYRGVLGRVFGAA